MASGQTDIQNAGTNRNRMGAANTTADHRTFKPRFGSRNSMNTTRSRTIKATHKETWWSGRRL